MDQARIDQAKTHFTEAEKTAPDDKREATKKLREQVEALKADDGEADKKLIDLQRQLTDLDAKTPGGHRAADEKDKPREERALEKQTIQASDVGDARTIIGDATKEHPATTLKDWRANG